MVRLFPAGQEDQQPGDRQIEEEGKEEEDGEERAEVGDVETGGEGEVAEPEGGEVEDEDEEGEGEESGAGALQIGGAEGDVTADAEEEIKAEVEVPVAIQAGGVNLLKKGEKGLPEFAAEAELAAPGDKIGRYRVEGAQGLPEFSAEEGKRDEDDQRRPEPDRAGTDEEVADILIKIFAVPAVFDITEDAVGAGTEEGDVADFVTEEDAEEGVAEFMHHRPRRRQPDVDRLAHEFGGADANRRREQMHYQRDQ